MTGWLYRVVCLAVSISLSSCSYTISSNVKPRQRQATGVHHTVKRGENLFRIALYYYDTTSTSETIMAVERIKQANALSSDVISPGQKLFIPGTTKKPPQNPLLPPETISSPALEKPKTPATTPGPQTPVIIKSESYLWPVEGKIICRYGELGNKGLDILTKPAAPVVASRSGTVSFAGQTSRYGETIIIQHPDGIYTVYGHDLHLKVEKGKSVRQGEVIAQVKNSTQKIRYVHFEIRKGTETIDPLQVLPETPKD